MTERYFNLPTLLPDRPDKGRSHDTSAELSPTLRRASRKGSAKPRTTRRCFPL
jgi:hypothetical protein